MRAAYRPFWFDELETWHIARLPSVSAIWAALCAAADSHMVLHHLSVRASQALFGDGYLATRLPALLGFWVMLLGLFVFLYRRLPLSYALVGMLFPMVTFAWSYSFEARAYGIWLGSATAALVAWQAAADDRLRPWSLIGICVALMAALASHPLAVLLAIPFGLGETVRTVQRRRFDVGVWLAFALAAPITLAYRPLLAVPRSWDLHGLQPGLARVPRFYATAFESAIAPLLLAGLICYICSSREKVRPTTGFSLPLHESAALVGFVLTPTICLAAGLVSSRLVFNDRYGLICVIGMAALVSLLILRAAGGSPRFGAIVATALALWLAAARGKEAIQLAKDPVQQFRDENQVLLKAIDDGRPVVVNEKLTFLAADFYLSAKAMDRVYHVVDLESAHKFGGQHGSDEQMLAEARTLPLKGHVTHWTEFKRSNRQFLLLVYDPWSERIYDLLLRQGWRMVVKDHRGVETLYEVSTASGPLLQ